MEPRKAGLPADVLTTDATRKTMEAILEKIGVKYEVMIPDVQSVIDEEALKVADTDAAYFENYHTYEEVFENYENLAAEFPTMASVSNIGKTYQDKDIKIITFSTAPGTGKPALWFDGGLHAREWITVATVNWMADFLVRSYGTDEDATFMLDNFDIIFCPIINVDGYAYTWTDDRMWRKTLSPNTRSCLGTDPNRNWAFHWGEAGSNSVECSDSYMGSEPASEVEVQTVQSYICSHNDTIKGYVNFHSYSQTWMSNWGYTDELPPDYQVQNDLSMAAVTAIKSVHGTSYEYGPIATAIYPASGSSADYTYGVCGVVYSYGVELRDTGKYGFLLPPDQIIPSGEETFAGLAAMARFIQANPQ